MVHTHGEIPDEIRFKPDMPLFANTRGLYRIFGGDVFHQFGLESERGCYAILSVHVDCVHSLISSQSSCYL